MAQHKSVRARRGAAPLRLALFLAALTSLLATASAIAAGRQGTGVYVRNTGPTAWNHRVAPLASVAQHWEPAVDLNAASIEDVARGRQGLPPRFAIPRPTCITPETNGTWESIDPATVLWRLRVTAPGAVSLNFGFDRYHMPEDGQLFIYAADREGSAGEGGATGRGRKPVRFTAADNAAHAQLWTPVLLSDDVVIEVTLPTRERNELALALSSVNVGYRGFGEMVGAAGLDKSGGCNVDVACPEGDPWHNEIATVGVISTGGSTFCTGFMVNNTAGDGRPYFMTANHCGVDLENAASLVVYWNFQSPACGEHGGGPLDQFQTGATFRASYPGSDFTLVELDEAPDPAWSVQFAGWDRSSADATSGTAIHHPNADEKSISFELDPLTTTSYLGMVVPGDASHLCVYDWDVGTTESGSSGSPLFDQNHRVVGQLHGCRSACDNDSSAWYGRFSVSWDGGGTSDTRLSDWLDPAGTAAMTVDTWNPAGGGLRVLPSGNVIASGPFGGPFTPGGRDFTLENRGALALDYVVTADVPWLTLASGSGALAAHDSTAIVVSFNAEAELLPVGVYAGTVSFTNVTDHVGDVQCGFQVQVGLPQVLYKFPFDSDPGWTTQGLWAFGPPLGAGGEYGFPDPSAGHTDSLVFGYNLAGDYPSSMDSVETLTTSSIDCSTVERTHLRFWRWLGVENARYDHASVRASNDGVTWTTLWASSEQVQDSQWTQVDYDLSAVADHQRTVYVQWAMGPTDSGAQYCGWNIDDVEIWGVQLAPTEIASSMAPWQTRLLAASPNPFNPSTSLRFELAAAGPARISIYDPRGRLVRRLVDQVVLVAGPHTAVWNGRDDAGGPVGSGVYLCRLESGGTTRTSKLTLVR